MTEISPNVFLSSYNEALDLSSLKAKNITHAAVIASEIDCPHQHYLFHQKFNIDNHPGFNLYQHLDEILDYIDDKLDRGKNVVILGNNGKGRSVSIGIAWVMKNDGMDFNRALFHLRSLVPGADLNPGFVEQLKRYEGKKRIFFSSVF